MSSSKHKYLDAVPSDEELHQSGEFGLERLNKDRRKKVSQIPYSQSGKQNKNPDSVNKKNKSNSSQKTVKATQSPQIKPEIFSQSEIEVAEKLLRQPNLFAEFHKDFLLTGYKADLGLATTGLLFLGRTLLPKSSALYCYGKTSSGKSEYLSKTVTFFPQHRVLILTKITPRFLYRAGGQDGKALANKILIFGEMRPLKPGEDDQLQEAIRQFVSENKLSLGSVDSVAGQRNIATHQVVYGQVTIAFTGIHSPIEWDDQIINRSFCCYFKHTNESIKAVLLSKATSGIISSNPFTEDNSKLAIAQRKWRAAFSLLKPIQSDDFVQTSIKNNETAGHCLSLVMSVHNQMRTVESQASSLDTGLESNCLQKNEDYTHTSTVSGVEIPFLEQLIFKKPRLTEPDMRAFDLLKNCIAVSALLHQKKRTIKRQNNKEFIVAEWQDYYNVKNAYLEMVPRTSQGLSNDLLETFQQKLLPWWQEAENLNQSKSKYQIATGLGVSPGIVKRWIYAWCDADLLEEDTSTTRDSKDRKTYYRLNKKAETLASEIHERGELKIDDVCVSSETDKTVNSECLDSIPGELSDWSALPVNTHDQL